MACRAAATDGLVHHSDRGVQYLSIRYTERLAAAAIERSVLSMGDSYDNAMAESVNSLFKTEVIRRRGLWRNIGEVEIAVLEWVDCSLFTVPTAGFQILYVFVIVALERRRSSSRT